jgi:hypothetical protein
MRPHAPHAAAIYLQDPSALPLRATSSFSSALFYDLRPAINTLQLCPITGRHFMQSSPLSAAAATAFNTIANSTSSKPAVNPRALECSALVVVMCSVLHAVWVV